MNPGLKVVCQWKSRQSTYFVSTEVFIKKLERGALWLKVGTEKHFGTNSFSKNAVTLCQGLRV
jgi:hypothetical protein